MYGEGAHLFQMEFNTEDDGFSVSDKSSVLCLNDDCLLEILSYLPLLDQVEFSLVCRRFQSIAFSLFSKDPLVDSSDYNKYNKEQLRKIFLVIGPFKTHITLYLNLPLLQLLAEMCPNVEYLDAYDLVNIKIENMKNMQSFFTRLKTLSINISTVTDEMCYYLKDCYRLERLNLMGIRGITGRYLGGFKTLKALLIRGTNFSSDNFITVCNSTANLQELDIIGCKNIGKLGVECLERYSGTLKKLSLDDVQLFHLSLGIFQNLEELLISGFYFTFFTLSDSLLEEIEKLKLTKITIYRGDIDERVSHTLCKLSTLKEVFFNECSSRSGISFLNEFELNSLDIERFGCTSSTLNDSDLMNFIKKLAQTLIYIDLSKCHFITDYLIYNSIDVLKTVKRTVPLKFVLFNTGIGPDVETDDRVKEFSNLIKLKY